MADMATDELLQQENCCRKELIRGQIAPDEYFMMVLSIYGNGRTFKAFPSMVREISLKHPQFHNQLRQLYETFYSEQSGFPSTERAPSPPKCELDEDLDLELALELSLKESGAGGSDIYEPEEADLLAYAQWGNGPAEAKPLQLTGAWANKKKNVQNTVKPDPGTMTQYQYVHQETYDHSRSISNTRNLPAQEIQRNENTQPLGLHKKQYANETKSWINHNTDRTFEPVNGGDKSDKNKKKKKKTKGTSICRPLGKAPQLFWFRRDLRLYDNPALLEACMSDAVVIPVFLWSEKEEGPLAAGGATKLWLHHALKSLNQTMNDRLESQIVFRKTNSCLKELQNLVRETGAQTVVWNDVYEPPLKKRDDYICEALRKSGVSIKRHHSYLLYPPEAVNMESIGMRGLGSVTHFMEACRQSSTKPISLPEDPPSFIPHPTNWPSSQSLNQLDLAKMPLRRDGSVIDWAAPIVAAWDFSEDAAYGALQRFLTEAVQNYDKESGRADMLNTCKISPYLHFGQISPRTVIAEAKHKKCQKFMRKLAWRDLSYFLLDMFPKIDREPMRPHYAHQRWSTNKHHLKAWQKGNTGYPLVDAAMRELWLTGWLNNYMRHVVASFLLSYLHLHWIEGYKWFQDTLVDADVAINAMMWQNGGMSGLDHWNFVMHPVDAAMTCDPRGAYVRRWVPELGALPDDYVCKPWKCPPSILRRAGVILGVNYPERIITNLEEAREQSLQDAVDVRLKHGKGWIDPRTGSDMVPLPNGLRLPVITRREFKYKTSNPEAKDNPHSAVLHGYRSRKRDEAVAFANKVDFLCSTMNECVQRSERIQKTTQHEIY